MLRRRHLERLAAVLVLAAALGAALYARSALDVDWSVESLRSLVDRLGIWAPLAFVLLVACRTPLLLPSQLVLTAGGLCFGTVQGTAFGALGLSLSGLVAFGVTRWLGAEVLRSRVPAGLRRTLEAGGTRGGAAVVALATAYPVGPVTLVQAAAALTSMGLATFLVAVGAGAAVRSAIYAYFGNSLIEGRWIHVGIATAVLAVSLLPLLHPRVRIWLRRQFEVRPEAGGPRPDRGRA
jgi:uncharacterized membrane protein YdjX (TVP38/TMEM64 family)